MNQLRHLFGLQIPKRVSSNAVATRGNSTGEKCIRKRYLKSGILKNVKSDNFLRRNSEANRITQITTNRYHVNPTSDSRSLIRVKGKTGQFEVARKSKVTKIQCTARRYEKSSRSKIPQSSAYSLSEISNFESDSRDRTKRSKRHFEKLKTPDSKNETLLLTAEKYPRSYAKLIANYDEELRTQPNDESRASSVSCFKRQDESERFSQPGVSDDVLGPRRLGSSTSSARVSSGPRDSAKYSEWLGVMEATLKGLKSHANLKEGAKIMKDTKFDDAEVLEFVDRDADWLDQVVAAHVAHKKPKPMTNRNELVSVAKSARGFATKSEITSDKKLTVGDRTVHPDSVPAKREYLLEYLAGDTSGSNFKIRMESGIETDLGPEVTLRLSPAGAGLSVNVKGSGVDLNLESLNDIESMKNVPEVEDYYGLTKSKLRNDLRGENLDKLDAGSSVYITVNEGQRPSEGTSGSARQIEIRVNGKAGTEGKTVSAGIDGVGVVSSVGNVDIVLPTFVRGKEGVLKRGERQGSFLNLQILSGREESVGMAVKGVSSSGSPGAGAAGTGSTGSSGNTGGSSSGGSKDPKNNSTVIRITSRVLPWWASPDSFRFIRDSGGTSGSGSTETGKAPSRSQSTNQVNRSRKLSDEPSSSVANDKKTLGKLKIWKSQSHGNILEKTKMAAVNEKTDSQQKLTVGSISRRSQIQNALSTGRGRSRKRRRSASAITKIIENEIKKKNDRISAKADMSGKSFDLGISKKLENFGYKRDGLAGSHVVGNELRKISKNVDKTGNVAGKKLIDVSDVTSEIQNDKKMTAVFNRAKPHVVDELEASKAKSMKIERSKITGTHGVTSANSSKRSEGVSGISISSAGQSGADTKITDKVKIESDESLDVLKNYTVNKGKSCESTDPATEAVKPAASGSTRVPETKSKKGLRENVRTGVSKIFRTSLISGKDTKVDVTKARSSEDGNSAKGKLEKNISKISSHVKSNILSKESTKRDRSRLATSTVKNSKLNFDNFTVKRSESKLKVDPLKPIFKKDDGTLIDYGLKVTSRKKSKNGLNELKISDVIDGTARDKSKSQNSLKINQSHFGVVGMEKIEISKSNVKTRAVERKASLTRIPRLKIVLEPVKKVNNIAGDSENGKKSLNKTLEKSVNPETTKKTISKNSHDPSISQNDVRTEKDLLYAIWLERFDRKMTKDKIPKSKPPKT